MGFQFQIPEPILIITTGKQKESLPAKHISTFACGQDFSIPLKYRYFSFDKDYQIIVGPEKFHCKRERTTIV